jgi:hypothetical protein
MGVGVGKNWDICYRQIFLIPGLLKLETVGERAIWLENKLSLQSVNG